MELRLLALACLVGAALAGPFNRDVDSRCSAECSPSTNKFRYEEGKKYVYAYKGENYISVAGGRVKQKAHITGTAEIHVQGSCEMILQMKNVEIHGSGSGEERSLVEQLEGNPVYFSWSDGVIEHMCPDSSDSQLSLNIKKAILSSIVNTMPDFSTFDSHKEVDSLGTCLTRYSSRGEYQGTTKVHKSKDLKSCSNRHSGFAALVVNPYNSPDSDINSVPIFTDEHMECEQEITQGIIRRVVCSENAVLQPLKEKDKIAEFKGTLELTLQSTTRSHGIPSVMSMTTRRDMLFNFVQEQGAESKEREAQDILSELCSKTEGLLHPSVSKLYYRLIRAVRSLPEQSVEQIYQGLKSKTMCHSPKTLDIFLDTLPMAGTEGAIKLMVKLIKNKEVTGVKAKLWPASLALIPHPTAESVASVTSLLSEEELKSPVLLGASAMIYKICSTRNCDQIEPIKKFAAALHRRLGERCSSDNDDEVIEILKSFGNMGYYGEALQSILQCTSSKSRSISRRLAAIDSFRRSKSKIPNEILMLFEDSHEDYEVRISAVIAAVKIPDREVFTRIQRVLKQEKNEQVQAFTSSLLKNLNETSSPLKQQHKKLLEGLEIPKYDLPYWTNSKNIELSAFNEPLNIGGSIESNIIHSPGSSVPRSGTARIDVDLFGKNINLLEIGVRAEGLEAAVKKMMGMHESESQKSWFSRSLQSSSDDDSKSEASFFLRTMNTEILDMSVSDLTSMGNMMQFADILNKLAQGESIDVAHSLMFVDSKIVVPSVTGRSYALSLSGTASIGLSANGKFDAVNLMSSVKNCDIEGRFQPSANVELSATVGIQSESSRPDVRIVTHWHSETDVEAKLRIKDGHLLHARWNLPAEKMELFKLRTSLFEVDSEGKETPIIDEMKTKVDHCTKSFVKPLGVEFCSRFEVPHPFVTKTFPFARGLGNLEMSLRKTDPSMQGYEIFVEIPKHQSDAMAYEIRLDTPGSSVKRKHSIKLEIKRPSSSERIASLHIESPLKDISASGSYTWQPELMQGALQVITDKTRRYSAKASLQISTSGQKKSLKPTIQWSLPESEPVTVSGTISYVQDRKEQFLIDLKSNKPSSKPFALSGSIMKDGPLSLSMNSEWKLSTDVVAKTPWMSMKIRGSSEKQARQIKSITSAILIDYKKANSQRHSVRFTSKAQESNGRIGVLAQIENTQYPSYNWRFAWDKQGSLNDSMKNDVLFSYGRNPESTYVHVIQSSKLGGPSEMSEGKISLKSPQFGVDSELKVIADLNFMDAPNVNVETDLRYSGHKHVRSLYRLQTISKRPLKMIVKAELEIPGRKMAYQDEIEEIMPNELSGKSMLQWQQGKEASLQYRYRKLSDRTKLHLELDSTFQAPFIRSPVHHASSLKLTAESFELDSSARSDSQEGYSLVAKFNRKGSSELSFKVPKVEGSMGFHNEQNKKSVALDLQYQFLRPRHIRATAEVETGSKKSLHFEILSDASRDPSQKVSFLSELQLQSRGNERFYKMLSSGALSDAFAMEIAGEGKLSLRGPHALGVEISGKSISNRKIDLRHSATSSDLNSVLIVKEGSAEKLKSELKGKWARHPSGMEVSGSLSLVSGDRSFENKELSFSHTHEHSHSSLRSNCQMQFQRSPEKMYIARLSVDKSSEESRELKASLTTPHQGFERQQIRLSQRFMDGGQTIDASVEYGSSKKAAMSTSLKQRGHVTSYTISMTTPYPQLRDAEFLVSLDNQRVHKEVESHLELNKELIYESKTSLQKQSRGFEFRTYLRSFITKEFEARVKSSVDKGSCIYEIELLENSRRVTYCKLSKEESSQELSYLLEMKSSENTIMEIRANKEIRGPSTKYAMDIKGAFEPVRIKFQTTKNDPNSNSLTAVVCHGQSKGECYSVKGYYKKELNRAKSRNYKKLTLDVEHTDRDSTTTHLGNIHYILDDQTPSLKSKLIIDIQNKKIGYEMNLTKRRSSGDTGRLEMSIISPRQTVWITGSVLQNSQRRSYELEIVPDLSSPSKKLTVSLKSEWENGNSPNERIVSGVLHVNHERLQKPIDVTFSILEGESKWPIGGRVEIDYSRTPGSKLTVEIEFVKEGSHSENQQFVCRISREDRQMNLLIRFIKQTVGLKRLYGWDWSTVSPNKGIESGGLILTISEEQNPTSPTIYNVTYYCPSSHVVVLGETFWTASVPTEMKVKMFSQQKLLGEMDYHKEGHCSVMEIKQSEPVWKNRVCLESPGSGSSKHLKVECFYHERKCVDANVDFDPSSLRAANIELKWKKQELMDALVALNAMTPALPDHFLKETQMKIYRKFEQATASMREKMMPVARKLRTQIDTWYQTVKDDVKNIKNSIVSRYANLIRDLLELTDKIYRYTKSTMETLIRTVSEYIPDKMKDWWNKIKEEIEKYIENYCPHGTFCDQIQQAYRRRGMMHVQKLLQHKFNEMSRRSTDRLLEATKWMPNIWERMKQTWENARLEAHKRMPRVFENSFVTRMSSLLREYASWIETTYKRYYQKISDLIHEITDRVFSSEDMKVLKSIFSEAKDEIQKVWRQLDFKHWFKTIPKSVMQALYPRKWVNEKFHVESDIPNGTLKIHVHQPLDDSQINFLRSAILSVKRQYQLRK